MQKGRVFRIPVVIELDASQANKFIRQIASLVEELRRDAKNPQPAKFTLEKPIGKVKRPWHKKGPVVNPSKNIDFSLKENRVKETKSLIRKKAKEKKVRLRRAATMITYTDFRKNNLCSLIAKLNNSPFRAVTEAVPGYGINPWEMLHCPRGFWHAKQNRISAFEWLIRQRKKDPKDISADDFRDNGLSKLLNKRQIYNLLVEYGYAFSFREAISHAKRMSFRNDKIYPWEMRVTPPHYFDCPENRIAATRWVVFILKKDPKDITYEDFIDKKKYTLIHKYENREGYKAALREAGFDV